MATNLSSEQILSALEELSPAELEGLVPRIIALGAACRAPHLSPEESKLLARIDECIPVNLKTRLSELEARRDDGSLTGGEPAELLTLSDRVERLHAERLAALADLAKLRGVTLPALMDQLGIR